MGAVRETKGFNVLFVCQMHTCNMCSLHVHENDSAVCCTVLYTSSMLGDPLRHYERQLREDEQH